MKYLTILLLFILSLSGYSQFSPEQQKDIDHFNTLIKNPESHDTAIAYAYVQLSELLYLAYPDTILPLCIKSKEIVDRAMKLKPDGSVLKSLKKSSASAYNNMGFAYDDAGKIDLALENYQKAITLNKEVKNHSGLAAGYVNIGWVLFSKGDVKEAINSYHKALELDTMLENKENIASALNALGVVYNDLGDSKQALKYYTDGVELYRSMKNKDGEAYALINIAGIVYNDGDTSGAIQKLEQSLFIFEEIGYNEGIATVNSKLGLIYRDKKDFKKALGCYFKCLPILEEGQLKQKLTYSLLDISEIYFLINDLKSAKKYGQRGLRLANELGYTDIIQLAADILGSVYEKEGDGMKALEMHKLFIQMRDSINNISNQKAVIQQATKYDYEKKKAIDDKENEKKVAVEKEAQKRQFIVLVIVIIASALVMILLLIIYRRLRITRKQKLIIEEQKEEVETQRDQIEGQKNEIEQKHEEIQESITYAKRIQNAILPPESFMTQHLPNNFVYYQPKDVVAGDFYWMEVHDDIVFFAAADCTGHGVPGAMVSVVCHNALNRAVREFGLRDTGKILDKVRELVLITFEKSEEQMKDGMDICLCAWNKKNESLQFSGANNPLYFVKDGVLETIRGTKQPIGHVQDPVPFESHNLDLKDIHSFYLTTDGYADQFGGPMNKKFSYKRLRELLVENYYKPMNEQHDILKSELNNWIERGSDEQIDDVCMMGVKV